MADGIGNLIGWEKTGLVVGKQWITAKDDKVSDVCNANGEMGVIGLYKPFSHGALTIPGHPNCRCEVVSVSGGELGEFAEKKELRKAAMQYARDNFIGKSYVNENSGHELKVTWQGVKHAASKANQAELSIITKLDDLLRYAKYEGAYSDKKGHPDIIAAHKYRAVAKVGNESLNIGVIVREFPDGHKHYDHFILKDE
ncbi:TPA: hypothetical protein WD536_002039 [Neisseria meningitidis]